MSGKCYEEFEPGKVIEHPRRRTVTERDNQAFCDLTMNQQPLHLDAVSAADTTFGERIVNGLYTLSLGVGLTIPETTDGTIVANLGYDEIEHPAPVFLGDTLEAHTTVRNKRETSDADRGIVTMKVDVYAVNRPGDGEAPGTLVCTCERTVLSLTRQALAD